MKPGKKFLLLRLPIVPALIIAAVTNNDALWWATLGYWLAVMFGDFWGRHDDSE